jgi:carbon-monoxide dehydrogenase medium subunit
MYATTYHRPKSLNEAASLFSSSGDAAYVSGGHTLLPAMKARLAAPANLIDLRHIPELKGIQVSGDQVTIGGAATHFEVAQSADVKRAVPALAALAGSIGDAQVRHLGTIGGSVANNDPAADYPAAVLALAGTVHTNKRQLAADDYFTGLYTTALEEGEIVTKVSFKIPASPATQSSATRRRAIRWPACSWRSTRTARSVSPSRAPAITVCSAGPPLNRRLRRAFPPRR